jgi:hypothetical protein
MKIQITLVLLVIALFSLPPTQVFAGTISSEDPASSWSLASSTERLAFSKRIERHCMSGNCNASEIKACLDEAFRPPIPAGAKNQSIADGATACIFILKSQQ